jgi:hypothetical protein
MGWIDEFIAEDWCYQFLLGRACGSTDILQC